MRLGRFAGNKKAETKYSTRVFTELMTASLFKPIGIVAMIFALPWGCSFPGKAEKNQGGADAGLLLPVVTDERTDLILSWFADGGSQLAASAAQVPSEARKEVRVQDPAIPPEKRNPGVVFLADLTARQADGTFRVWAVSRSQYDAKYEPKRQSPEAKQTSPGFAGQLDSKQEIVMYSTRYCPVCKKARVWLLDNKIPYIEKDVERDQSAADELAQKAKAQSISTSGVPVFDIRGRLLPGFDPVAIKALLEDATTPTPEAI